MERAMLASPRGSFAPAQALVAGFCRMGLAAMPGPGTDTLKRIQIAVATLLATSGAFEVVAGGPAYGALLLTGSVATLLSIRAGRLADVTDAVPDSRATPAEPEVKSEIILQLAAQKAAVVSASPSAPALNPEAWGELMARVSHDLRTPLNAVIGFSDVMGSELFGPVGDVRYREYIAHIRESGRELLKSAEDTLAITALLGSGNGGANTRVCLAQLADDLVRTPEAAGLDAHVEDGADVICERRGLRQALVNLTAEASLRAAPGARPQLSATCEDDFVIVEISVIAADRRAFAGEAPLHICIARVLLELQGAQLIEIERDGRWTAVTVLTRAAQHEFFAPGTVPMGWRPKPSRSVLVPA